MSKIFCVYITFYKGNRLPPFYIGYSYLDKIAAGYRGSVSSIDYKQIWTEETTKNQNLFRTHVLKSFDSAKEAQEYEEYVQRFFSVHTNPMYSNKSISGKAFLCQKGRKDVGRKISAAKIGKKLSPEHIEKLKISHLGQIPWNKGKRGIYSNETRRKISHAARIRTVNQTTKDKLSKNCLKQWRKQKEKNIGGRLVAG